MSKQNDKIETRLLKNTIVDNLLERQKGLSARFNKNKEYWALQLLRKLGLLGEEQRGEGAGRDGSASESDDFHLDATQREKKLREQDIFVHRSDLEALTLELRQLAAEAARLRHQQDQDGSLDAALLEKFKEKEILDRILQIGVTKTQALAMAPGEKPFKDHLLGDTTDPLELYANQKNLLEKVQRAYQADYRRKHPNQEFDGATQHRLVQESRQNLDVNGLTWAGIDPPKLGKWKGIKKLDFERKKLHKLLEFYRQALLNHLNEPTRRSFLQGHGKGELKMLENTLRSLAETANHKVLELVERRRWKMSENSSVHEDAKSEHIES